MNKPLIYVFMILVLSFSVFSFSSVNIGNNGGGSSTTNNYYNVTNITGGNITGSGVSNYLSYWTNSTNLGSSILYQNGSSIGIGITNTASKLDVQGGGFFRSGLNVTGGFKVNSSPYNTFSNTNAGVALYLTPNSASVSEIQFGYSGAESRGRIFFANSDQKLSFTTNSNTRMTIDSNGRVGIGQTNPAFNLDVQPTGVGASIITTTAYGATAGNVAYFVGRGARGSSTSPTATLKDDQLTSLNGRGHIGTSFSSSGNALLSFNAENDFNTSSTPSYITFGTTPVGSTTRAEVIRINSKGYLGILTTNPLYPLQVNANVSGISIYAQANISATGYITRTDVYDKNGGTALSKLKDASAYVNYDGTINHKAFEYSYVNYTITKQVGENKINKKQFVCDENNKCEYVDYVETVPVYATVMEEGVDLVKEVALLKQAVYETNHRINTICAQNSQVKGC